MSHANGISTFLAPSSSSDDVDIQDPNNSRRSRISYTREFLLSLSKADRHNTIKLPWDVQLIISCVFQDSTGLLLPPPLSVPDSGYQDSMPQKSMPQNVTLEVSDDVNLLHRSNEPYRPPRRHKALPPSTRDSNDSLSGDTSGSSEKTEREGWGKGGSREENMTSPDVKAQQELELNSSNTMLHENSDLSSELCLPDEDSLITFDEPLLMAEVENLAVIDNSSISNPESSLVEDDLFSPSLPHDWAEKLVQSILSDDHSPDPYMVDPMVHHGAELDAAFFLSMYARQSYTQLCSHQLNSGWDQQVHSSFLRRSLWGVSQSVASPQLPEFQMAFCTKNLNSMQNCLGHKKRPSYAELLVRRNSEFQGDGYIDHAVVNRKLRATL